MGGLEKETARDRDRQTERERERGGIDGGGVTLRWASGVGGSGGNRSSGSAVAGDRPLDVTSYRLRLLWTPLAASAGPVSSIISGVQCADRVPFHPIR